MIQYNKVERGDILRVVEPGAPGYAEIGELVRVVKVRYNAVDVESTSGKPCEFCFNCGAARLEETEWKKDFPSKEAEHGNEQGGKTDTEGLISPSQ